MEPEPEPEPEPVVEPEPEPEPEPEEAKPVPPKPRKKPEIRIAVPTEEKPKEPQEDRLASILRNVEKLKEPPPAQSQQTAELPTPRSQQRPSRIEVNEMVREIQRQMAACWRIEPGARDAADLVVQVRVNLNPDGSVRRADIVDVQRMIGDAFFRSAAENARRAILRCSPFELPPKKFEIWREMTLNFNPREMFGG